MLRLFNEKDFVSEGRKERKKKRKIEAGKLWDIGKILTKDGIYCSYLECVCSIKGKYYKSKNEYLGN